MGFTILLYCRIVSQVFLTQWMTSNHATISQASLGLFAFNWNRSTLSFPESKIIKAMAKLELWSKKKTIQANNSTTGPTALAVLLTVWISTAPMVSTLSEASSPYVSVIDEQFDLANDVDELPVDEFLIERIEIINSRSSESYEVHMTDSVTEAPTLKSLGQILLDDDDCNTFMQCGKTRNIPFLNTEFPLEATGCSVSFSSEASFPVSNGHILPTVFLIGCQKCGSTSLYENLVKHPNILKGILRPDDIGLGGKEPHFFDATIRYERSVSWYANHFPLTSACNSTGKCITIDGTPDSMLRPAAPTRIRMTYGEHSNQLKFLIILRDPISRCLSYYQMARNANWQIVPNKNASFKKYMSTLLESFQSCSTILDKCGISNVFRFCTTPSLNALRGGLYAEQLKTWLNFFDPSQFMIIPLSKLSTNPRAVMKEVFEFLGLPDHIDSSRKAVTANKASKGPSKKTMQEFWELVPTLETFYAEHNANLAEVLAQVGANASEFDFVQPGWRYTIPN